MSTSVHAETTRTHTPPLDQKIAVIFGASGAGGAAVAREFAAQGATVFLSGRTLPTVEHLVSAIQNTGGVAQAAEVNALNEPEVNAYLDRIAREAGSIDLVLNLMGPKPQEFSNGRSTLDLPLEHFVLP